MRQWVITIWKSVSKGEIQKSWLQSRNLDRVSLEKRGHGYHLVIVLLNKIYFFYLQARPLSWAIADSLKLLRQQSLHNKRTSTQKTAHGDRRIFRKSSHRYSDCNSSMIPCWSKSNKRPDILWQNREADPCKIHWYQKSIYCQYQKWACENYLLRIITWNLVYRYGLSPWGLQLTIRE